MGFLADHAADATLPKWRLYFLDLPTPAYWTDLPDHDIETVGGAGGTHRWISQPIEPGPVNNQPSGASASFRIADADGVLFPILNACNWGELAQAKIYEAGFALTNKSALADDVAEVFSGRVDRVSFDSSNVDLCEIVLMPADLAGGGEIPTQLVSTLVRVT